MMGGTPSFEEAWRKFLVDGEEPWVTPLLSWIPSGPRCTISKAPFHLPGSLFLRPLGFGRSALNPSICGMCEQWAQENRGGAEIELTLLFADVRGSTSLAEQMGAAEYRELINRFYVASTDILARTRALVDKLVGDQVIGLYTPGLAGRDHARVAVEAAEALLRATGHADTGRPWIPLGIGIYTGEAFVGAVGGEGGVTSITALGDAVNIAARLSSEARTGEILIGEPTCSLMGAKADGLEQRRLEIKGRSEGVDVRVLRVGEV
jgi:adenylate cyclase